MRKEVLAFPELVKNVIFGGGGKTWFSDRRLIPLLTHPGWTYPIEMRVERVLAGILLTAVRTDDTGILVAKMNVLDVPLQRHLMKI